MTKEIKLSNSNLVALVDDEDYEYLNQFKWRIDWDGYVSCLIRIHHLVVGKHKEFVVDHKNGDKTCNTKENLRVCTHTENVRNSKSSINSTSKYKGVSLKRNGTYSVNIRVNEKNVFVGYFDDEIIAAKAYDQMARKFYKDFAYLNFPDDVCEIVDLEHIFNKKKSKKSNYFGVYKFKNKFRVLVAVENKDLFLGSYSDEKEAAMIRDKYLFDNVLKITKYKLNFSKEEVEKYFEEKNEK